MTDKCGALTVEIFCGQMYNKFKGVKCAMKHEITTLNTKRTLAASLRGLMKKKPLSKITVSEIIADCGVLSACTSQRTADNRQTGRIVGHRIYSQFQAAGKY